MELSHSFFEDEIRNGFYVPGMVKRAWASELKVFREVDRICRKHNIRYFADWGTLLGAVRHHGFIPWDDDFDIVMLRKDYEHFLQVAKHELPDGYEVFNYQTHENFWYFLARVVAKPRICFEEEHLEEFYGFPYIVGIDIFIMDYISEDPKKEEIRAKTANYVLGVADGIGTGQLTQRELREHLRRVGELCGTEIPAWSSGHELKVSLYRLVEKQFARFAESESGKIAQMMPCGLENENLWLPKEYYEESIEMPFEHGSIPVPIAYDAVLRRKYGDYMVSSRNIAGHNYPFFMTQREQLEAILDFELPGFRFREEMLVRNSGKQEESLKHRAPALRERLRAANEQLGQAAEERDCEAVLELLKQAQEQAIELGTMIEQGKRKGLETVVCLENYCEAVFRMHSVLSDGTDWAAAGNFLKEMRAYLDRTAECMKREILDRREMVFLPYKAACWDAMASVYQAAAEDPDCDVYVVSAPYYEKDFLGNFTAAHDESGLFPEEVLVTPCEEFDFRLHHPDCIVIQNPYDGDNPAVSVQECFYSRNLQEYTDLLVYIPYFTVEEFTVEGTRAYGNMRYYCTMPAVIYADRVFVQSENMKKLYVEKLTEFAGEATRAIWEKKIVGAGSPQQDIRAAEAKTREGNEPESWSSSIVKQDGSRRKVILYFTSAGTFVEHGERALQKLKKVLSTFEGNREEIAVLWYAEMPETSGKDRGLREILREYAEIIEQYRREEWVVMLKNEEERKRAAAVCDAYYGCGGELAQRCIFAGKPVMIQDTEV